MWLLAAQAGTTGGAEGTAVRLSDAVLDRVTLCVPGLPAVRLSVGLQLLDPLARSLLRLLRAALPLPDYHAVLSSALAGVMRASSGEATDELGELCAALLEHLGLSRPGSRRPASSSRQRALLSRFPALAAGIDRSGGAGALWTGHVSRTDLSAVLLPLLHLLYEACKLQPGRLAWARSLAELLLSPLAAALGAGAHLTCYVRDLSIGGRASTASAAEVDRRPGDVLALLAACVTGPRDPLGGSVLPPFSEVLSKHLPEWEVLQSSRIRPLLGLADLAESDEGLATGHGTECELGV